MIMRGVTFFDVLLVPLMIEKEAAICFFIYSNVNDSSESLLRFIDMFDMTPISFVVVVEGELYSFVGSNARL